MRARLLRCHVDGRLRFHGCAGAPDDGRIGITDVIIVLHHLFAGGPPPAPPHPACGNDPTPDGLDCRTEPVCMDSLRSVTGG